MALERSLSCSFRKCHAKSLHLFDTLRVKKSGLSSQCLTLKVQCVVFGDYLMAASSGSTAQLTKMYTDMLLFVSGNRSDDEFCLNINFIKVIHECP